MRHLVSARITCIVAKYWVAAASFAPAKSSCVAIVWGAMWGVGQRGVSGHEGRGATGGAGPRGGGAMSGVWPRGLGLRSCQVLCGCQILRGCHDLRSCEVRLGPRAVWRHEWCGGTWGVGPRVVRKHICAQKFLTLTSVLGRKQGPPVVHDWRWHGCRNIRSQVTQVTIDLGHLCAALTHDGHIKP